MTLLTELPISELSKQIETTLPHGGWDGDCNKQKMGLPSGTGEITLGSKVLLLPILKLR